MKKVQCIVVDDEAHIRTYLRSVLQRVGLDVVGEAANGDEGLALVEKMLPDLVMMDVNMPIRNGDEVISEMKEKFPLVRSAMLTSVADMGTISKCIEAGADDYIRKDTPYSELKEAILQIVADMGEKP